MSITLSPVPSPGIAVFPFLIAKKQETVFIEANHRSKYPYCRVSLSDGTTVLTIHYENGSWSRRKTIYDAQGRRLCQLRRKSIFSSNPTKADYYAETHEFSPNIWELSIQSWWDQAISMVSFPNGVNGGRKVELWQSFEIPQAPCGVIKFGDMDVAIVERPVVNEETSTMMSWKEFKEDARKTVREEGWSRCLSKYRPRLVRDESWNKLYQITVAKGVDMFLPVALVLAVNALKSASSSGSADGGGGGGGDGGCGGGGGDGGD
jgi:hypothetical protein